MSVFYEWDLEEFDPEYGDVVDHDHADRLIEFARRELPEHAHLVLIRDEEKGGNLDRSWAYVQGGHLPEFFKDAYGHPTTRIPRRFHRELMRARSIPALRKFFHSDSSLPPQPIRQLMQALQNL